MSPLLREKPSWTKTEIARESARTLKLILEAERVPRFIEGLQEDGIRLSRAMRREIHPKIIDLGKHVARVVDSAGGLVSEDNVENRIHYILTLSGLGTFAERELTPVYLRHYERVANLTALRIMRSFPQLSVDPAAVARFVLERGGRRAGLVDLTSDTRAALFRILDEAREKGIGVKKLGKEVISQHVSAGRFVHAGPRYRGQLIARTETLHAQRVASITSYRISQRVETVLAYDGDDDEECAARNGEYFTLDDADIENDLEHPNGTLAWGPVVQEVPTL